MIRLQKIIADSGLCSRRRAEDLIIEGRVLFNGKKATIGQSGDPAKDKIVVDGKALKLTTQRYYFAFYKPINVETTLSDPKGRRTVALYMPKVDARLYPVGRLDTDSEGLLLLTNDGQFGNRVMHPRHEIEKSYTGVLDRRITSFDKRKIESGVRLTDGKTWPAKVEIKGPKGKGFRITIHEGKNRIIRRMFGEIGYSVDELKRVSIGPVNLGSLKPGKSRKLSQKEIDFFTSARESSAPSRDRRRR